MTRVIHAVSNGDQAFWAHSLITGDEAIVITTGTKDRDRIADHFRTRKVEGSGEYERLRGGRRRGAPNDWRARAAAAREAL